jgi:high affinity sulfate transporter 1
MATGPAQGGQDRPGRAGPQEGWARWLPGLAALRSYEARWLPRDLGAGLVLTAVLVPVGLAYAVASGLPGVCGLYATIFPLVAYALFGPSRVLVFGPDSSLAAIILGVVAPVAAGDPNRAVALAGIMAIVSGSVCILAGVARLGFVTELLSKPIRYGYMNGIALTVLVSQAPKLIGVKIENAGPLREIWSIAAELFGGRVNWAELALGAATLATILAIKSFKGLPGVLFAIVGATAIVQVFDLQARAHVRALAPLPQGLPSFSIPWVPFEDLTVAALGGLAVALVSFADTSVLSRAYSARLGAPVDPNQEMIGLGAANLAAGFFQGFPISSSSSRTPVAEAAGARTQLTGVAGAVAVALLLLVAPRLLENLPNAALAAVVIASAIGLFEVSGLDRLYRIEPWEFWLSIVCFAGVAVFGAIPGIGIAVVLAVIEFLWDGWRPHSAVLGRVEGVRGYHDITRYPQARQLPGLLLFRWDAPLFFANAEFFKERVLDAAIHSPTKIEWLVVAAEPVTSVDVTAADSLAELDDTLRGSGAKLCFAELTDPVMDKLKRFGLFERIGETFFFATLGAAVDAYQAAHEAGWTPGTGSAEKPR